MLNHLKIELSSDEDEDISILTNDSSQRDDRKSVKNRSKKHEKRLSYDDDINKLLDHSTTDNVSSSILTFPIARIDTVGEGSSSIVYKSVLLNNLQVCAEKVVIVSNKTNRNQLIHELEFLKSECYHSLNTNYNKADNNPDKSNLRNKNSPKREYCPYIVNLLDILTNPIDGTLSICLEYMDMGSLQDIVKTGGCQNELILSSISYQMLEGLKYLHDNRIIHRDVKPSNALLSSSGLLIYI